MIKFDKACRKALKYLKKYNGNIGLAEICSLPDRWIFIGYGGGPYGNVPVTIDKENGDLKHFPLALVENQDLYYDVSVSLEVPEQYR